MPKPPVDPNIIPAPEEYVPPPEGWTRRQWAAAALAAAGGAMVAKNTLFKPDPIIRMFNLNEEVGMDCLQEVQSKFLNAEQQEFYAGLKAIIDNTEAPYQRKQIATYLKDKARELGDQSLVTRFEKNVVSKAIAYVLSSHFSVDEEQRTQLAESLINAMPLNPKLLEFVTHPDGRTKTVVELAKEDWVDDSKSAAEPHKYLINGNEERAERLQAAIDRRIAERLAQQNSSGRNL